VPKLEREAAQAATRRRLETAVRQLRERLRRGDLERGVSDPSERRFARAAEAARDESAPGGDGGPEGATESVGTEGAGDDPTMASADGDDDVFGGGAEASEGAGAGPAAGAGAGPAAGAGADRAAAPGQGYGHDNGGDPLGRGAAPPTRGHAREAHVRDGAGPTRSEVIEASARRGFAARDYVRVFDDYEPVVEESLAASAVPEGRRYVVRRYFQLIRPRAAAPGAP
jgi:hypothetical protein